MGIIGTIAALSIPSLVNTINKKLLTVKLKNHIASIQQLINDQMIMNKTRNLSETDFADPATLLTSSNFAISETCSSAKSCWTEKYRKLNGMSGMSGESTEGTPGGSFYGNMPTIILKNGTLLSCDKHSVSSGLPADNKVIMWCFVDLNGKEGPNVNGRDYFAYYITNKGNLMDNNQIQGIPYNESIWLDQCKNGSKRTVCVTLIQNQGWKMTY